MAVFTAVAAAIVSAIGITGTAATIFTAIGATVLSVGVSSLIAKRMQKSAGGLGAGQGGGRVQLPPATDNKLPVVYGSAYVGGPIIDAKLSTDQKYMWYVVALAEVSDDQGGGGGSYTFDTSNIYYDGKRVQFGANGVVTGLINNTTPATIDTKVNGKIYIWLFTNGSSSGINTGGQTAIQILSDATTGKGIPSGERWNSSKYTSGGQSPAMTNTCFAIVRVEYNTDAGTTSLGGLQCKITNSITKPGDAILDYLLNDRYGCAVPLSRIDTTSLTALNTYSDEIIDYGTGTQARYRIDGPIATNISCLENLQILVDACDSWLQYNELNAKWSVVINQSYTDYTTINDLFLVDSSNLVGGINVAPINLNETFNQMEVAYPNQYIKDQIDYQLIELEDYQPGILSPNEAINKLDVDFPVINNSVQTLYVGVRRLLQSREDLTITCQLDYSGIQIEAGDVIRVKHDTYGWDVLNSGYGKLFRVATVAEEKYQDGSLGVAITAFEYNDTIYDDRALLNFQPSPNTGLQDPNIIEQPAAPTLYLNTQDSISTLEITGSVPDVGLVKQLDFNYGFESNTQRHIFYSSVNNANGAPLAGNVGPAEINANQTYRILTIDDGLGGATTDWSSCGANTIDLSDSPNVGGYLQLNKEYIIYTSGNTDWTAVGASSNSVGTVFSANGLGSGNGVAFETIFVGSGITSGTGNAVTSYTIPMNDLPTADYYWSVTARNDQVGVDSPSSNVVSWQGGVSSPFFGQIVNCYSNGSNIITHDATDNAVVGGTLVLAGGPGTLAANSYIAEVTSNTQFVISTAPTVNLANSVLNVTTTPGYNDLGNTDPSGGITGNNIQPGTVTFVNLGQGTGGELIISDYSYSVAEPIPNIVYPPVQWNFVAMPSNANLIAYEANGVFDQPKYVTPNPGNVASSDIFPYWSGTSTTANGYLATSTAPFYPADATQFAAPSGYGGGAGGVGAWWPIEYSSFVYNGQPYNVPGSDFIRIEWDGLVVANNDTRIQLVRFIKFRNNDFNMYFQTDDHLLTIDLKANEPQYLNLGYQASGVDTINGGGMAIRLLQDTSNVYILHGELRIKDIKG